LSYLYPHKTDGTSCDDGDGSCLYEIVPGTCLIGGACYNAGDDVGFGETPHCYVCDPEESQAAWTTPAGLSEDPCNNIDDDCDGETDEWPLPDGFEPNDEEAGAYGLSQIFGLDEAVVPSDAQDNMIIRGTSFHSEDDVDYFSWTFDLAGAAEAPQYWMCRVEDILDGQFVRIWLNIQENGKEGTGQWSDPLADRDVFSRQMLWVLSAPDELTLVAGVAPLTDFSACHPTYKLVCQLRDTGRWQDLIPPDIPIEDNTENDTELVSVILDTEAR
jgi:hypothetical protein